MTPKGSHTPSFTKRIPRDIRDRMLGRTLSIPLGSSTVAFTITPSTQAIRFSLRTANPAEARIRQAEAVSYVEQYFEWVRSGRIVELTHRQITALAGEFYRAWSRGPDGPGAHITSEARTGELLPAYIPEDEELRDDFIKMEHDAGALAAQKLNALSPDKQLSDLGTVVDGLARQFGFPEVSEESRSKLLAAILRELPPAREAAARTLAGDYTPDPRIAQFPPLEAAPPTHQALTPGLSLTGLAEDWWREASAAGITLSTYEGYAATFRRLSEFLGHDDAARVTPADVVRYKDHRLNTPDKKTGKTIKAKTFKGVDLSGMRSIFDWAVGNLKLPSNPAKAVTVKPGRQVKLRERDFTEAEANALLTASSKALDGVARPNQTQMAIRWVPWLCAYSGARVGEIVQLRKEDFRKDAASGIWVMTITPEAGTVKGKEAREVPLHAHLIEMGFAKFVEGSRAGYLFMTIKPDSTVRGVWRSKKNRLAEFAREHVTDPNVAPNHGWRHTFKTKGFEAGIQEKVLDAICGHAPASVGRAYGSVSLQTKVDAMAAFPRYAAAR